MLKKIKNSMTLRICLLCAVMLFAMLSHVREARAEYGDIVMNNSSEASKVEPVVFPHWFHRIRYTCKACHSDLGIKFKAGASQINMVKIMDGQYCGACHDGNIAWSTESCDLCHTGKKGLPTSATHQQSQNQSKTRN